VRRHLEENLVAEVVAVLREACCARCSQNEATVAWIARTAHGKLIDMTRVSYCDRCERPVP
jgi:hypothetical protein